MRGLGPQETEQVLHGYCPSPPTPLPAVPGRRRTITGSYFSRPRPRISVVCGPHLGKEHARILSTLPGAELVGVADVSAEQATTIAKKCGCRSFTDYRQLLPLVEAAVIATPTKAHYAVAKDFLKAGIPTLVEKPIT